uniref:Uncharacterized protein n=1 Tax=Branchiostoma floridae TaxID=7739 RepID=C3YSX5_BRAFL|eukprot:XP_002600627.1 hypothetical protein BRAFLDRAFT_95141 [Branchiostoma floridae]
MKKCDIPIHGLEHCAADRSGWKLTCQAGTWLEKKRFNNQAEGRREKRHLRERTGGTASLSSQPTTISTEAATPAASGSFASHLAACYGQRLLRTLPAVQCPGLSVPLSVLVVVRSLIACHPRLRYCRYRWLSGRGSCSSGLLMVCCWVCPNMKQDRY